MGREQLITVEKSFAEWRKDPNYVKAYNALADEFSLAEMIRARASAGLTQEQLAQRMNTTQAMIARLESGRVKRSPRTLNGSPPRPTDTVSPLRETDRRSEPRSPDTRQYDAASSGTGKSHIAIAIRRQLRAQRRACALLHRRRSGQPARGRSAAPARPARWPTCSSASISSSLTSWAICRSRSAAVAGTTCSGAQ